MKILAWIRKEASKKKDWNPSSEEQNYQAVCDMSLTCSPLRPGGPISPISPGSPCLTWLNIKNSTHTLIPSIFASVLSDMTSFPTGKTKPHVRTYSSCFESVCVFVFSPFYKCLPSVQHGLFLPSSLYPHFFQGFPTVPPDQTNLVDQHPPTTATITNKKQHQMGSWWLNKTAASTVSQQWADLLSFRSRITSFTRKSHITLQK